MARTPYRDRDRHTDPAGARERPFRRPPRGAGWRGGPAATSRTTAPAHAAPVTAIPAHTPTTRSANQA